MWLLLWFCWSVVVFGCPTSWVNCGSEGDLCRIPHSMMATTIAYGSDKTNSWTYMDVTNGKGELDFLIRCSAGNFGDIAPGKAKQCCFNAIYSNSSQPLDNSKWRYLCTESKRTECLFPVTKKGYAKYVKYCSDDGNDFCTYRMVDANFYCSADYFAEAEVEAANFYCSVFDDVFNVTTWYACGDNRNKDSYCTMDMDTTDNNIIRATKMCYDNNDDGCAYRWSYHGDPPMDSQLQSYSEGQIPCETAYFGWPSTTAEDGYSASTKYCYVVDFKESTEFVGPLGYWNPVSQCNCPMTETLSYGVTSTTSQSTTVGWTTSWSHAIEETVKVGIAVASTTTSYTSTTGASRSISHTMGSSMSVSVTQSCGASCGLYNNGTYTMYQWIVTAGEYVGTEIKPFDDYSCVFFCSNSKTAPQCPPQYCKNYDCTECYPWKSINGTLTTTLSPNADAWKWADVIPIDDASRLQRLKIALERN